MTGYPVCPWCGTRILPDMDTARHNGVLWHAGCFEDYQTSDDTGQE